MVDDKTSRRHDKYVAELFAYVVPVYITQWRTTCQRTDAILSRIFPLILAGAYIAD
ncbi:MAG: hypothetical protein QXH63_05425 [Pyrobaculum sp.]